MVRRVLVVGIALALLAGSGCATRADRKPIPAPTITATPTVPGRSLRQLGAQNGPTNLALPPEIVVVGLVDQPNVVTVLFDVPGPGQARAHLVTALPAAGFSLEAWGEDGLVFTGPEWTGSWTATNGRSALTLRRA